MMVRRERIPNPELMHHSETDAIGKGPLFVAMLAKPGGCAPCRRRLDEPNLEGNSQACRSGRWPGLHSAIAFGCRCNQRFGQHTNEFVENLTE
jgi:hypothetical protein